MKQCENCRYLDYNGDACVYYCRLTQFKTDFSNICEKYRELELYRVLEDLRYENEEPVIIEKGAIVEVCDDFPFYRIEKYRKPHEAGVYKDFDDYGMEVHMSGAPDGDVPWHGKLERIIW